MTNSTHTVEETVARLRELLAKATPGPWAYRPQEPTDWAYGAQDALISAELAVRAALTKMGERL